MKSLSLGRQCNPRSISKYLKSYEAWRVPLLYVTSVHDSRRIPVEGAYLWGAEIVIMDLGTTEILFVILYIYDQQVFDSIVEFTGSSITLADLLCRTALKSASNGTLGEFHYVDPDIVYKVKSL